MASPIDVLTGGLRSPTGLALASRGFLLESSAATLSGGLAAVTQPGVMTDVLLAFDAELLEVDVLVDGGDLVAERGLVSAVALSLFSDRRAETDDRIPDESGDPRGWWADGLTPDEPPLGSRLWLLAREKRTDETLNRAQEFAHEALDWLLRDGIAAAVDVVAQYVDEAMRIEVGVRRPSGDQLTFRFLYLWQGTV